MEIAFWFASPSLQYGTGYACNNNRVRKRGFVWFLEHADDVVLENGNAVVGLFGPPNILLISPWFVDWT